ncbi:MAG TPA: efflux RND transporter periplasmic adaptor subunit [Candidatus Binatia bacterium]|nr:efflux RND transporter periplasmic adaptor subunit [Candidatus Binatia bacterium]
MKKTIGLLVALGLVAAVLWIYWPRSEVASNILEASGRIEGDQVAVGAKVGGRIVRLPVQEGQTLPAGEVIAELSSEQAKAQLEQAEHDVHAAREEVGEAQSRIAVLEQEIKTKETAVELAEKESRARIGEAESAVEAARARLPQAQAERQRAERDFDRSRQLLAKGLIATQEADHASTAFQSAKAEEEVVTKQIAQAEENLKLARTTTLAVELRKRELAQARERLREARAALEAAKARVQTLEARVVQALADVKDTRVVAPFNGTVLQKLVQEGQVVAPGSPLVTFVDMSKLYVKVYIPEMEIAKVRLGDPARVYVDAFPKKYFEAAVSEVSQQAEFTPRDVHMKDERVKLVFAVKLTLENPQGFLKPGMPADAKIKWKAESAWEDGAS